MAENTDYQSYPLTQVFASLTPAEQLQVIVTHPFFTGKCPECGYQFPLAHSTSVDCHCPECGWVDNSDTSQKPTLASDLLPTGQADVKRLGSYLVEAGLLTQAEIDAALADQEVSRMRLGEVLVKLGWINQQTIEYLMEKVVLPERVVAKRTSFSY